MEIVDVKISELVEDPRNARTHDKRNLDAIKASLKRFGQVEPLVVRTGSNVVVGGNGRLTAMRSLKWKIAAVTYQELTDTQAAALGIALNRTAELAMWDEVRLADLIVEISKDDFVLPAIEELDIDSLISDDLLDAALAGRTPPASPIGAEEISVDGMADALQLTCPRCHFQFNADP